MGHAEATVILRVDPDLDSWHPLQSIIWVTLSLFLDLTYIEQHSIHLLVPRPGGFGQGYLGTKYTMFSQMKKGGSNTSMMVYGWPQARRRYWGEAGQNSYKHHPSRLSCY